MRNDEKDIASPSLPLSHSPYYMMRKTNVAPSLPQGAYPSFSSLSSPSAPVSRSPPKLHILSTCPVTTAGKKKNPNKSIVISDVAM